MTGDREHTARLLATLHGLEADLTERSQETAEHSRGASVLLGVLALVMAGLSLANIYLVNDLTQEVRLVIRNMDEMSGHLAHVTTRMTRVQATTQAMEADVRRMSVIALQTREIAGHMDRVRRGTGGMRGSVADIDGRMEEMTSHVLDMSGRLRVLNQGVGRMGRDVNEMAAPLP